MKSNFQIVTECLYAVYDIYIIKNRIYLEFNYKYNFISTVRSKVAARQFSAKALKFIKYTM